MEKQMEVSGDFPRFALVGYPLRGIHTGAQMERLIELVDAFFARHGIECPAGDRQLARPNSDQATRPAAPTLTTALPQHDYRKGSQADPTP